MVTVVRAGAEVEAPGKSLGEKEFDFLNALQNFYLTGKPSMSNEEFDTLKDELQWAGSKVVIMTPDEQRFLEAVQAFSTGKPVMSDAEYDKLKDRLKIAGSMVAIAGPRCSLRTQAVYSDSVPDLTRMFALNIPGLAIGALLVYAVDQASGVDLFGLFGTFPSPFNTLAVGLLVLPVSAVFGLFLTSVLIQDSIILKGPCPNCGAENVAFFGDILTIKGESQSLDVQCGSCSKKMNFSRSKRRVVLKAEETASE